MAKLPKRVNLADVETTSERVMPGSYHAKVAGCELKENKAGDGHYFNVDLVITSEGPAKGRHVWEILPLKEGALWKLKGFLEACGVEDDNPEIAAIPDMVIGTDVDVVVGEEEYQGEMKARVRKVKPSTVPSMDDLAEDDEDEEDDDDDDDDGEGDDDTYTEEELKELDLDDLKEIAEEYDIKVKKGAKKKTLIAAILEAQEEADEDEDEDDEEEEDEAESSDDDDEDDDLFGEDDDEEEEPAPKKASKKGGKKARR